TTSLVVRPRDRLRCSRGLRESMSRIWYERYLALCPAFSGGSRFERMMLGPLAPRFTRILQADAAQRLHFFLGGFLFALLLLALTLLAGLRTLDVLRSL